MLVLNCFLLLIALVFADPKGPGYEAPSAASQCGDLDDTCFSTPQKVVEKDVDRRKEAEDRCADETLFKTPAERESCRTTESNARRSRAEKRERAEKEAAALLGEQAVNPTQTPPAKLSCNTTIPVAQCDKAYKKARNNETPENIRACEAACSPQSFENKQNLMACTDNEKTKASGSMHRVRRTCGTGGLVDLDDEAKKDKRDDAYMNANAIAESMAFTEDGIIDPRGGMKPRIVEENNPLMGPSYCVEGENVCVSQSDPSKTYNPTEMGTAYANRYGGGIDSSGASGSGSENVNASTVVPTARPVRETPVTPTEKPTGGTAKTTPVESKRETGSATEQTQQT